MKPRKVNTFFNNKSVAKAQMESLGTNKCSECSSPSGRFKVCFSCFEKFKSKKEQTDES